MVTFPLCHEYGKRRTDEVSVKIAVCVKRVPDTETRIKVAADGKTIDESAVKFVLNPFDEFAVEEALKLKEKAGEGEVVVVSVGGESVQETIRTALAMGADRGVLLKTGAKLVDPLATARLLAKELEQGGYDLILFGKQAWNLYSKDGILVLDVAAGPETTQPYGAKLIYVGAIRLTCATEWFLKDRANYNIEAVEPVLTLQA